MKSGTSKATGGEGIIDMPTTRAAARALGAKKYFTGLPCPKGHVTHRYVAGGGCAGCCAARAKEKYDGGWRQDAGNRKQINAKWNASTKGAVAKRRWRDKDPKRAWAVYATGGAKARATQSGVPFDLDYRYVVGITPDVCPVFGTPFAFVDNGHVQMESATLDRMRPELGYVVGNVVVISMRANTIKSNATSREVTRVAEWMQEQGL